VASTLFADSSSFADGLKISYTQYLETESRNSCLFCPTEVNQFKLHVSGILFNSIMADIMCIIVNLSTHIYRVRLKKLRKHLILLNFVILSKLVVLSNAMFFSPTALHLVLPYYSQDVQEDSAIPGYVQLRWI